MAGFICFMVAAVTPIVLYRLMPVDRGCDGRLRCRRRLGSRRDDRGVDTALMVKSLGASKAASAATRAVGGQAGVAGASAAARPVVQRRTAAVAPVAAAAQRRCGQRLDQLGRRRRVDGSDRRSAGAEPALSRRPG